MLCYNCGRELSSNNFCNSCGADVGKYKKIMYTAEAFYDEGLERANVRDLSGAVLSLKQCLKFNKNHIDARNLLGLIYFEMGEAVSGVSEWIISKNLRPEKNIANDYIMMIQQNQNKLESITNTIKKYNKALELCHQESPDLAIIQLKKVLSINPKYVQAHLLLALLYYQQKDYDKARRETDRVLTIDKGNLMALRYQKEIMNFFENDEDKPSRRKKFKPDIQTYKSGNDVIIQPLNPKEPVGVAAFLQISLGIIIGLCVTYFLVLPAKIQNTKDAVNSEIASYGEQIDKKNTEIEDLNTRVSSLEQTNLDLQSEIQKYEGTNGAIDANNALIEAAYAYMVNPQDDMTIEKYLDLVGTDYIENNASEEYIELYNHLKSIIGDSVADTYYNSGIAAYNEANYNQAILDLQKAYTYDSASDKALYYLALAYLDSGDVANARDRFSQLVSIFPDSEFSDKALQRLEEISD